VGTRFPNGGWHADISHRSRTVPTHLPTHIWGAPVDTAISLVCSADQYAAGVEAKTLSCQQYQALHILHGPIRTAMK
jgi:hypothetical protein